MVHSLKKKKYMLLDNNEGKLSFNNKINALDPIFRQEFARSNLVNFSEINLLGRVKAWKVVHVVQRLNYSWN